MSTVLPLLDNVIESLKLLTETIVVKYSSQASKDETLEKTKAFDYYYLALNKQDTFDTYPKYSEEALINAGVLDPEMLLKFMQDKTLIPVTVRSRVLEAQRFIVVRDFEERNNYYRTFIGLPHTDDTELFYVDEDTHEDTGVPMDVPIHKLHDADIAKLQGSGFISKLIKERPDKPYLKYIGRNRLDLHTIRSAKNLAIIQVNKRMVPDALFRDFMLAYEQCREYFMVAIYIKEYASMHTYYDNIMGFMVMVSAIRRVMTNTFKNGIDRDFYDLTSIIKMFEAYQIPFIQEYTLEQHRIVLRNINHLIRIKATDRVLVDLVKLLGFTDVNIFKYYLVKSHKKDIDGNPVFKYKDIKGFGKVLDNENMYDINFSRVNLEEKNIGLAITNEKNRIDYVKVTESDPFWWEDEDLKNTIYQNEFNYLETKYISFEIMYKMSKVVFESIYFLSMLHDRKKQTSSIELFFNKIDYVKPIDLFDICILLFALTAKKQGLKGEIIHDPTKIGHVLGFNFKADLKPIIDQINNDPQLRDPELVNFISDMSLYSIQDVDNLYRNIKGFKYYIEEKLYYATDKDLYYKYKTIYDTLMTTEYMGELFMLPDGDIASTYKEYLMYTNYELYEFLENLDVESISDIILHILTKIQEYCQSVKYIHQSADGVNVNAMALMTLANFFKSYTVDIEQFNIIYVIDGRMDNLIKFIDQGNVHVTNTIESNALLYDTMDYSINIYGDSLLNYQCRTQHHTYLRLDDKFIIANIMDDKISQINVCTLVGDVINMVATITQLNINMRHDNNIDMQDLYKYIISIFNNDGIPMENKISINTKLKSDEILNLSTQHGFCINILHNENLNTKDAYHDVITIKHIEDLRLIEKVKHIISLYLDDDKIDTFDTIPQFDITIYNDEKLNLKEVNKYVVSHIQKETDIYSERTAIHHHLIGEEVLNTKDKEKIIVNIRSNDNTNIADNYKYTITINNGEIIDFINRLSLGISNTMASSLFEYDTCDKHLTYYETSRPRMCDELKIVYN